MASSNFETAITRAFLSKSVDINIAKIYGLQELPDTFKFWFRFLFSDRISKPFSGIFVIHVLYMMVINLLKVWRSNGKWYKTKPFWPRWRLIFISKAGWLRDKMLRPIPHREWIRMSKSHFSVYICLMQLSRNRTFQYSGRNIGVLPGALDTQTAKIPSIDGV